jgi:Holliday junction DNA helicase RuvB
MNDLRPTKLKDIIGQKRILGNLLEMSIPAAKKLRKPLPHLLLGGPPGLGKTTIAKAIAHEMDGKFHEVNGSMLRKVSNIVPFIMRLNPAGGDILFVDEVHQISTVVQEYLYPVMEDFRADVGEGDDHMIIDIGRFTLIGATTEAGILTLPFNDRFVSKHHLQYYTDQELAEIATSSAKKLKLNVSYEGLLDIAKRSRGTARVVNSLLRSVHEYAVAKDIQHMDLDKVRVVMNRLGIDERGLNEADKAYIRVLEKNGETGLDTLIAATGFSRNVLLHNIESFLIRANIIKKTSKGRKLVKR